MDLGSYGPYNVLVNSVCPGYTATARLLSLAERIGEKEGITPPQVEERWARQVPLGRVGRPEEFAHAVAVTPIRSPIPKC